MFKQLLWLVGIVLIVGSVAEAEIVFQDPNFVVDVLFDQIDQQIPRLEAIRNPDYGFGVVAASIDQGILKVLRISQTSVELLGSMDGFPYPAEWAIPLTVRFDTTGVFENKLLITTVIRVEGSDSYSDIITVNSDGSIVKQATLGGPSDQIGFVLDISPVDSNYLPGAYLEDTDYGDGTSYYHMDPNFNLTKISQDLLPPGRTDLDIYGMEFDPTGLYGYYLTMLDSDHNHDQKAAIYQLYPDLSWIELTEVITVTDYYYRDMCFSSGGSFGQMLYVTRRENGAIIAVDPNGDQTVFASGFSVIGSITVSDDGEHMFVSDINGIYRIRKEMTLVGPTIVMREPKVEDDGVHTNPKGVDDLRILFSESVEFDNADVNVIDQNNVAVPCSVSGSNSQFMIIVFGEKLIHNKYKITIKDTVVSAETGNPIDGDNDGFSGGDAVIVMEHRERHDSDNDNDIDFCDLADFANKWLWMEGQIIQEECFPSSHRDYDDWVTVGRPDCWCCPTQCHGDTNCDGVVDDEDLSFLEPLVGSAYPDLEYDPCYDLNHDLNISIVDLNILRSWHNQTPPSDCLVILP